jgi:hypothetical protein
MASKAKKRKRSSQKRSGKVEKKIMDLDLAGSEVMELAGVRKGLLKSLVSSLLAISAILVVYFLNQKGLVN